MTSSSSSRLAPSPDSRAAEREEQDDPQSSTSNSTSSRFPWFSSTASNSSSSTVSSSSSRTNPNIHSNLETVRASLRAHPDGHEELDSDARKQISTATVSLRAQAAAQAEADAEVDTVVEEEDHSTDASHLACYFLAGGAAGATSRTVVSPLERLKIIMQVQPHSSSTAGSKSKGGAYSGVISGLSKMWREEGMKGFMRGNGINCLRIFPYSAVQFTTYESAKSWLRDSEGELTVIRRLAAGGFAGIASVVSTYPLDLVRSRISIASASLYEEVKASTTTTSTPTSPPVSSSTSTSTSSSSSTSTSNLTSNQSTTSSSPRKIKLTPAELRAEIEAKQKMVPGIWKMTVKVYREEGGIRGLYRGCVPTSAGVMPYVSLNFIGYEYLRKRYAKWTGEFELDSHGHQIDHISAMGKLACGALAGSFSQTLTYPLDVLRRRMQVAGMKDSNLGYNDKNSFDCIRTIMRAEGFKGLYRGLLPNLLKVAPSIGTSFCTYELVRDGLERYFASYNQTPSDTRNHN